MPALAMTANVKLTNVKLADTMATPNMVSTGIGRSKKEAKDAVARAIMDKIDGKHPAHDTAER